jgi:hydrogenase maturation protease
MHVSPHQVGIGDLLAAARLAGTLPERVSLVAIQPEAIEVGLDLTPAVAAAVPLAATLVRDELAALAVSATLAGRAAAGSEPVGAAT